MNLYLVSRRDDWSYDEYDSMVVVAESAEQAKQIDPFSSHNSDEIFMSQKRWEARFSDWTDSPENLDVTLLGKAKEGLGPGVILASYNAG